MASNSNQYMDRMRAILAPLLAKASSEYLASIRAESDNGQCNSIHSSKHRGCLFGRCDRVPLQTVDRKRKVDPDKAG